MIESVDHKADLKYIIRSDSIEGLFRDVALATHNSIFYTKAKSYDNKVSFNVKSDSNSHLVHDFIEELIYYSQYESQNFLVLDLKYKEFELDVTLGVIKAKKEDFRVEVKACSYNVSFDKDNGIYKTSFILDI